MSTRSFIGIKNTDGTVRAIYHHWDGYIEGGVGEVLFTHYQDIDKINKLIDLGDMSMIGTEPVGYWSDWSNTFGQPDYSRCMTYRERGETGIDAKTYKDEEEFLDNCKEDYTYLFKDGEWFVRYWDYAFKPLKTYFN